MAEGDAYITNDPWKGTGHLNDFVVTTPCFHEGRLVGLFGCTSHLTDIGGIGFGPDGTDVHMEGLFLPFLKIVDRGRVNDTLIKVCKANSRLPVEMEGDIYSLVNCNEVGCRRLVQMMEEFGLESLDDIADHIVDSSRRAVLEGLRDLPRGTYRYAMTIDGYDAAIDLVAAVEHRGRARYRRLRRHVVGTPPRHQRAAGLYDRLYLLRPDVRAGPQGAEQCGFAWASSR